MKKFIIFLFFFNTVFAQKKEQPKIIAYATGNAANIKNYPVQKLTHIIYSFLKLQNDTLTFRDTAQENTVMELVALKQTNPNLKIMVSIGGWGGCAPCSNLFSSEKSRHNFAATTVDLFKKYGIDGLDLDWEYPAIEGYPGHAYKKDDKDNFTALVKELRKQMGSTYILSFAAGGFESFLEQSIDWDAVMPQLDFVNLMTYDLVSGFSSVTGHHTPLYDYRPGQQSTSKCVNWLLNKNVPAHKLIIGVAIYARVWQNVIDSSNGLYQTGTFKQGVSYKNFDTYFADSTGYKYYWDKKAKAPYYYNKTQQLFATFDDAKSIKAKTQYVKKKKLGGIMFWQLTEDKPQGGLVEEMYKWLR